MGWERGYYYRVRKVHGRVVREYLGKGWLADLAAATDAHTRAEREARRETLREERAEQQAVEEILEALDERADLAARAALLAAGYHQHKRGEWRKRRG
jgi:hypothetical protein